MHRRSLLRATGVAATVGLAGCVGGQPAAPDGTPTEPPTSPPTSFETRSTRCGNQVNRANVTATDGTVVVEGTTWGNDACYVARLEAVTLQGGTLTLRVVTESAAEPGEQCAQCITEIDYRATVQVAQPPETVVVVHDGETVLRTSP